MLFYLLDFITVQVKLNLVETVIEYLHAKNDVLFLEIELIDITSISIQA